MTKDERVRFTLRLPKNLIEDLRKEASEQGSSINALILNILWEWAEKYIENWIKKEWFMENIEFEISFTYPELENVFSLIDKIKEKYPNAKISIKVLW